MEIWPPSRSCDMNLRMRWIWLIDWSWLNNVTDKDSETMMSDGLTWKWNIIPGWACSLYSWPTLSLVELYFVNLSDIFLHLQFTTLLQCYVFTVFFLQTRGQPYHNIVVFHSAYSSINVCSTDLGQPSPWECANNLIKWGNRQDLWLWVCEHCNCRFCANAVPISVSIFNTFDNSLPHRSLFRIVFTTLHCEFWHSILMDISVWDRLVNKMLSH